MYVSMYVGMNNVNGQSAWQVEKVRTPDDYFSLYGITHHADVRMEDVSC